MSAQSPGAYSLSFLLHGGAAGLVLLFTYVNFRNQDDTPKTFELVAGPGYNYGATEAPALGNTTAPIKQPQPLPPDPTPPAPPQASPIQAAPEAPAKPTAKPKAPPNPADLVKNMERAEERRKANLERKYQREKAAEAKRLAAANAAKLKHIDAEGIAAGVTGGATANKTGGASGKALTREEQNIMDSYFAGVLQSIRDAHVQSTDVAENYSARVQIFVAADGAITAPHIVSSSGNAAFDQSVIEACLHAQPVGPRPDGRGDAVVFTFKQHEDDAK